MDKDLLNKLIEQRLSTRQIADELNMGQTTVRYWMKKYNLSSKYLNKRKNGLNCVVCDIDLMGLQKKYCSTKCKQKILNTTEITYKYQQERGVSRKKILVKNMGGECEICGYDKNLAVLSFHHKNPKEKDFHLTIRALSNRPFNVAEEEALKCSLLCANCHLALHYPNYDDWK